MKRIAKYSILIVGALVVVGSFIACSSHHDPEHRAKWVLEKVGKKLDLDEAQQVQLKKVSGEVMDRVIGLELGADDYLPKPFEPRELVARVQSILKRTHRKADQPVNLCFGALVIDTGLKQASIESRDLQLSTMEYHLLELLAHSAGTTLSRDDILNTLRGTDSELYTRSVDIAISRLRQKLKPMDVIKTVRGSGYVFVGKPS